MHILCIYSSFAYSLCRSLCNGIFYVYFMHILCILTAFVMHIYVYYMHIFEHIYAYFA